MSDLLSQLKDVTTVVVDSGDLGAIEQFRPVDATTNPSLLLNASQLDFARPMLASAISYAKAHASDKAAVLELACDKFAVDVGTAISKLVPGRVSTEVDARLSFDTAATVAKALQLIELYQQNGISTERILIKIASTWEGIQAARQLEQQGIQCNLTLLFHMAQARACAEAGAYLISPFVGRILDWYKANTKQDYTAETDPGVLSVRDIYHFYKEHGYPTVVMGASFRNTGEVLALAGCDRLTISPALLDELSQQSGTLEVKLVDGGAKTAKLPALTESEFRWMLNEDAMATEKLAEGIRKFAIDQRKLEQLIGGQL
ncbi:MULTISPECIES: transaldolase [unclassified Arsukibacterium]|uniref:transaldolase n=1 Tax=unclassified Arsukibacterium TaxID=2635278 RepID=UPI000C564C20|nr:MULTISPECIES: transaldolase [unclassified Arsukibacterium]MAA93815.1 transaldolase [Rheinheimera sp.]MBM34369.1 transaldolase [Rheinheimera sp.]HAW92103.1 transaldolase [Candidatus Azambacteria bacterium]|tara:strand:- start:1104 stop:2054 length:951 start_codon:yes stop_codon:yes gene_type:complete